jgi:uncharacterized membrane protein YphA (DoxX/SURF4 family)
MTALISLGRVLFALLFIVSGAAKLFDLPGTAQEIAARFTVPADLADFATSLEAATSFTLVQILAIAAGAIEFVCGVLIAFNIGVRFFSIVLVLFLIVTTFYAHDFWNQTGGEARLNMVEALTNLSLIGALLVLAGIGRSEPETAPPQKTYSEL